VFTDSLEGRNLGKYRVLEPLGRGGMARVYRAYHAQLDRYVAIKVLRSDLVEEEEFLARFRREAQAVAALRHPNIVQVFDFDTRGSLYYMVMELLEGDTLCTRMNDYRARDERMPWGELIRIMLDVLDGMAYAHSEGMIHRDIKPANILLTKRGQAVLTDFGIAQIVGGTRYTVSGALMGTLAYMAPEQGLEGHTDSRSDIYSVGIVFYEMLVGEPPFDAETPLAILMKHVNDPLPSPRKSNPDIPKHFERVALKVLSKRPQDRYQSAEEMAEALRTAAKKTRTELPTRISLPLSFTTSEAPAESVVVLSGTAREKVGDAEFAASDTDLGLGQRLAAESAALAPAPVEAPAPRPAPSPPPVETPQAQARPQHKSLVGAILTGLALIAIGNLIVVFFGIATNWWGGYRRGWPIELLLVGLALALVMEATGSIWMLIPTGIILGNGFLMSFSAITNAWSLWNILWPLELVIVLVSVFIPIQFAKQPDGGRKAAVKIAQALKIPTVIAYVIVIVLGTILGS